MKGAVVDTEMFLTRGEQHKLVDELREIPDLVPHLAVAYVRQSRRGGSVGTRRPPQSTPPIDIAVATMHADATDILDYWARLVAEQRGLDGPAYTLTALARWLDRHVIDLAMTHGAEQAYDEILGAVATLQARVGHPEDKPIDRTKVEAANRQAMTAYEIERIAYRLGDLGRGLNRDRVRYLVRKGLRACTVDEGVHFYRLGDVLAAHQQHQHRTLRGGSAA